MSREIPPQGARRRARAGGRNLLRAAALVLLGCPVAAPTPAAERPRFRERAEVLAVEIPVQVTRDGQPVRGLTAEDFQVFDGRKRLDVVGFEAVDLASAEAPPPPEAGRRHVLLFFDLSFSLPRGIVRAQEAALDLVDHGLHPTDRVGVATWSLARGVEVPLGFTSDRDQVRLALQTLGLLQPVEEIYDPLGLAVARLERDLFQGGESGGQASSPQTLQVTLPSGDVRSISVRPRDSERREYFQGAMLGALRDLAPMADRAVRETRGRQVQQFAGSLEELGRLLASVDGRKHVVFFSEGFDSDVVTGTADRGRVEEIARSAEIGELWKVDSDERFGSQASRSDLRLAIEAMRRADAVIHSVDIAGLRGVGEAGGRPGQQEGLFHLAAETGGELTTNVNDLGAAMEELLRRNAFSYLLVVQPPSPAMDGAWHPLEIRLARKTDSRGTRLSYRSGYYDGRPFRELAPEERRLANAQALLEGEEGGAIGLALLAAPFAGPGGQAYLLTVADIDGPSLLAGQSGGELPLEVYVYAVDRWGGIHDLLSQALRLDVETLGPQLGHQGFRFVGHLRLAPGAFTIRFLLRNVATGATALRRVEVEVPDFPGGAPAVSVPLFIEPEGRRLVVWEQRMDGGDRYPLESRQGKLVPAPRPVLLADARTPMMLVVQGLGDALEARAVLRAAGGREIPVELALENRFDTRLAEVDRLAAAIRTGRVQPGEYDLEVVLTDTAGGGEARAVLPVLVPKSFGS